MENKNNNNYVKSAFDKIEIRKTLLNNKALKINDKIKVMEKYIDDNEKIKKDIYENDMVFHRCVVCQSLAYMILWSVSASNIKTDANMAVFLWGFGMTEMSRKLIEFIANTTNVPPLKDSVRRLKRLLKEDKKAKQFIKKLQKELEDYREKQESKAHETITDIFSKENMYYDEDSLCDTKDNVKSM